MDALWVLLLVIGSVLAGRIWQWSRDRAAMQVGEHLGRAFDAISDITAQRRQAEDRMHGRGKHRRGE